MANTFVVFDKMKLGCINGDEHFSGTYRGALMSTGWTPSMATSTLASLTTYFCTQLSGNPADKAKQILGAGQATAFITLTAEGIVKVDLTDINFTASSGLTLSSKYGVLWRSKSATVPMGYWELSTTEVVNSQINITWPTGGLFETSDNV